MMIDGIQQLRQQAAVHSEKFVENRWVFGLMVEVFFGKGRKCISMRETKFNIAS